MREGRMDQSEQARPPVAATWRFDGIGPAAVPARKPQFVIHD
jgi:hypothetical protein